MPVLLLAYGDPAAKDMLRRAIEARYGTRPPVLDSLIIEFKGRAPFKIGPIHSWVPLELTAHFRFPDAMRWDFRVRPLKLPVQRGIEAYDGEVYRSVRGGKPATIITDPDQISSMRRRLWATASILLTPLSNTYVKVEPHVDNSFSATNTQINDAATLFLNNNGTLNHVQVDCAMPDGTPAQYTMRLSEEQTEANEDLLIPRKISTFWDDTPDFEFEPVSAQSNPDIPDTIFRIEDVEHD